MNDEKIIFLLKIIVLIVDIFFCIYGVYEVINRLDIEKNISIIILFLLIAIIVLNFFCYAIQDAWVNDNSIFRKYLLEEIENWDSESPKCETEESVAILKRKSILLQMYKNNIEINEYFKISKRQANSSFRFSIIACIIGILMISISLYMVFEINDTEFAIISIAGGAITELISGAILVVHNKSALQLNYYYDALHENEKFLLAIDLADKLEKPEKEKMYMEIIKAQIRAKDIEETKKK